VLTPTDWRHSALHGCTGTSSRPLDEKLIDQMPSDLDCSIKWYTLFLRFYLTVLPTLAGRDSRTYSRQIQHPMAKVTYPA